MTSSTSSSSRSSHTSYGPVLRSLAVFLALFVGYNLTVRIAQPQRTYYQNQWEKNRSLAEDYVLDRSASDAVMVGSSLAARLEKSALGPGIRNLAFAGGTSATGLEIVRRRESPPRLVLVEANVPRDLDSAFVRDLYSPLSLTLKRWIPSARVRYRPVNLVLGVLKGDAPPESTLPVPAVFAALLADQARAHATAPDSVWLEDLLALMARQVKDLGARGTQVIFFEMPVDSSLVESPSARAVRAAFRRAFPADRFEWIGSLPGDYVTGDGIHLAPQSAAEYAAKLRAALEARWRLHHGEERASYFNVFRYAVSY